MKKTIRIAALIIAAALTAALFTGCGGKKDPEDGGETTPAPEDGGKPELESLLDRLGYDYVRLDDALTDAEYVALFETELEKGRAEGYTPILLPFTEGSGLLAESMGMRFDEGYDVSAELAKPLPNGEKVIADRTAEFESSLKESIDSFFGDIPQNGLGEPDGSEGGDAGIAFGGITEAGYYGNAHVLLVKLPTDKPWEAALYLPFGGFNECPEPQDMAAVLKLWYEKYGAVPAVITHDMLDMYLPAPLEEDSAAAAAREQLAFDYDMVMFGEMLPYYVYTLTQARSWSFWWD
ncbi:MAG: DUF4253 domain-containing protein [Clostridia bacterium]|nr:DUF4253 domain-containing protein [Clostridia bacterium]